MTHAVKRFAVIAGAVLGVAGCDRVFAVTPAERVGYLRELVRARTVSRDTLPIDGCSVTRFMDGIPAWRDSLIAAERAKIMDATPCPDEIEPVRGRFVLTSWYRNWSGEYVIRGAEYPWDQGYRFTDGVFVGREQNQDQAMFAGNAEPRRTIDTLSKTPAQRDSIRRAGMITETRADSVARDSSRR
ncbi:MAG: hypothetical protein H7099_16515 [Gemmatimonadaceae bacterium]|nr:hypothetical protein [Gemmatimonadaceae bacterium]